MGTPGRCRSIFTVDVVNNSPQFKKSLKGAAAGNPCVYFYRNIECQNNAKFSICAVPSRGDAAATTWMVRGPGRPCLAITCLTNDPCCGRGVNATKPAMFQARLRTGWVPHRFSFAVDPLRSVFVVHDAPEKETAKAFMKTVRTDGAMDMDMLGKPGKIQMSVVEEFELRPRAEGLDGFAGTEYRTDAERGELMDPLMAAAAGLKTR